MTHLEIRNFISKAYGIHIPAADFFAVETTVEGLLPTTFTATIRLTPTIAGDLKTKIHNNRNLKALAVASYKKALEKGLWVLTHQGLAITQDKVFADGQHRVEAVLRTGKPIITKITFGLSAEAVKQLDQGTRRTHSDAVRMEGIEHAGRIVPMLSIVYKLFGYWKGFSIDETMLIINDTAAELEEWLSLAHVHHSKNAVVRAATFLAIYGDQEKHPYQELMEKFFTGVNLPTGSPILSARKRAFEQPVGDTHGARIDASLKILRCFKAWYEDEKLAEKNIYAKTSTLDYFMVKAPKASILRQLWQDRVVEEPVAPEDEVKPT